MVFNDFLLFFIILCRISIFSISKSRIQSSGPISWVAPRNSASDGQIFVSKLLNCAELWSKHWPKKTPQKIILTCISIFLIYKSRIQSSGPISWPAPQNSASDGQICVPKLLNGAELWSKHWPKKSRKKLVLTRISIFLIYKSRIQSSGPISRPAPRNSASDGQICSLQLLNQPELWSQHRPKIVNKKATKIRSKMSGPVR